MAGVEFDQTISTLSPSEDLSDLFGTFATSSPFLNVSASTGIETGTPQQQLEPEQPPQLVQLSEEAASNSFVVVESEWDPVEFDLKKSNNPKWKSGKTSTQQQQLKKKSPKRIQDIRLARLDSGTSSNSEKSCSSKKSAVSSDFWPYDDDNAPGSPCALFGKHTSSPAAGFEGEFSRGDPEWGDFTGTLITTTTTINMVDESSSSRRQSSSRSRNATSSSSDRRRRERQKQQQQQQQQELQKQQQQQQQYEEEEGDGDDQSAGSYELEDASQSLSEGEEDEEGEFSDEDDESERSISQSSNYDDDDNLMVTPAMGKSREPRKKPPTLKRGTHGVATPSVVKAMKNKQAFTSDDEGDNDDIDFDSAEFDSDLDSAGSGHSSRSKSRDNGSSRSKREGRLEAANASFRRQSISKRKEKFNFDRSMSSADLKAARKANNSFKGHADLNKSFSSVDKRRVHRTKSRSEGRMQNSFSSSSGRKSSSRHSDKSPPRDREASSRGSRKSLPARAKSMGNPSGSGSKLKSALAKFSGADEQQQQQPTSNANATGGKKSSTLSALKALSGSDGAASGNNETDLKNAIMQQVYRSSSGANNAIELKRKPKPKITKTASLSASGMARAAAASGEIFPNKDGATSGKPAAGPGKVRRSKTSSERNLSSISDFNASYHENIAKMRKQKMADASEKSSLSQASSKSEPKEPPPTKERPNNLDRRVKSFSHSRSGTSMSSSGREEDEEESTPERSAKPRLKRGSSKRLEASDGDTVESSPVRSPGRSPGRRNTMSKSGSSRRVQRKESAERIYDPTPQPPVGPSVIALLRDQEPVTDKEMMQKGNRQMFHALMYKTRMGMDMDRLRRKVEGLEVSEDDKDDNNQTDDEDDYATESGEE